MAYDPKAENLAHLRRIITSWGDFKGRSQRSEFLAFLVLMMALSAAAFVLAGLLSGRFVVPYGHYFQFGLWLLAIPLFVRRLHDQNRSGWFALILPVLLALKLYERFELDAGRLLAPNLGFPYNVLMLGLVVVFWVLLFWPGTDGENRFGLDPRKDLPVPAN